ncbi:hypothetical protein D3C85_1250120 [compost metagenome]
MRLITFPGIVNKVCFGKILCTQSKYVPYPHASAIILNKESISIMVSFSSQLQIFNCKHFSRCKFKPYYFINFILSFVKSHIDLPSKRNDCLDGSKSIINSIVRIALFASVIFFLSLTVLFELLYPLRINSRN